MEHRFYLGRTCPTRHIPRRQIVIELNMSRKLHSVCMEIYMFSFPCSYIGQVSQSFYWHFGKSTAVLLEKIICFPIKKDRCEKAVLLSSRAVVAILKPWSNSYRMKNEKLRVKWRLESGSWMTWLITWAIPENAYFQYFCWDRCVLPNPVLVRFSILSS